MPRVFAARKNQKLAVSDRQFSIIVGSLFGDAYVSSLGKIQLEHSKKAKQYVEWKFRELGEIRYQKIGYVKRKGMYGNQDNFSDHCGLLYIVMAKNIFLFRSWKC